MAEKKLSGIKIVDKDNQEIDVVYAASDQQFYDWLRSKGRIYIPFYPGSPITLEDRLREISRLREAGKI